MNRTTKYQTVLVSSIVFFSWVMFGCTINAQQQQELKPMKTTEQTSSALPNQTGSIEQEIRELERRLADAYLKSDANFLEHILADDYMVTDGPGTTSNKAKVLNDYRSGDIKVSSFSFDEQNVRVYGDTAIVTGQYTWKANYKGSDRPSGTYRYLRVYAKTPQGRQIVAGQVTPVQKQQ